MRRSGKFYNKNEKNTLTKLGLIPAPQSGAGWIIKEDGENELAMVQLKSTDSASYRISSFDLKQLEYHAAVSHKVPIFLIQFLQDDRIYAVVDIQSLGDVHKMLKEEKVERKGVIIEDEMEVKEVKKVKSNKRSREKFFKEREESFGKRRKHL